MDIEITLETNIEIIVAILMWHLFVIFYAYWNAVDPGVASPHVYYAIRTLLRFSQIPLYL